MDIRYPKIAIIGAGISGLTAAKVLEENGYSSTIFEQSEGIGGRLKTAINANYCFDHGFQVLLTAYPMVKKHLNLNNLELQYFKPGAQIYVNDKLELIGDPLRDIASLLPTIKARSLTTSDKIKIYQLTKKLKAKSIEAIFQNTKSTSTLSYLQQKGFSSKAINQ